MSAAATYGSLAGLPLQVEDYALERLERRVAVDFTRVTTVVRLRGGGREGRGEDVTYESEDQDRFQGAGPVLPLAGRHDLDAFSRHLEGLELFPAPPRREVARDYRRWAFESAALDLALRQAGRSLAGVLGREPRPVRFVVSLGLGRPPTAEPLRARLALYPGLRFKLDPSSAWDDALVAELRALGVVDTVDLKGHYRGTPVDQEPDSGLYRRVAEGLPGAWIEDAALTPETDAVLRPHRARLTWDAPIHSVEDVLALPFEPRAINVKPSRSGSLARLCALYDHCARRKIACYGGGQFELGPGRGQIQVLASLFHPDAPNDVAPVEYNRPELEPGWPSSPLAPSRSSEGFSW